jgi:hypothetical protein
MNFSRRLNDRAGFRGSPVRHPIEVFPGRDTEGSIP